MASLTMTATDECPGGNHVMMSITGARTLTVQIDVAELRGPMTDDDLVSFIKMISRLGKIGRTNAQLRALLIAGVTVTV